MELLLVLFRSDKVLRARGLSWGMGRFYTKLIFLFRTCIFIFNTILLSFKKRIYNLMAC